MSHEKLLNVGLNMRHWSYSAFRPQIKSLGVVGKIQVLRGETPENCREKFRPPGLFLCERFRLEPENDSDVQGGFGEF